MEISGEFHIPAIKQTVWEGLNNPNILKASIPGCEELDKLSDKEFTAAITTKLGPVKAKFKAKVTLSDLDPPNKYTISGEGQGGAAGFASGSASVSLIEEDKNTKLIYHAEINVGGKIAQIGSRLIDSSAKKISNQFFVNFCDEISNNNENVQEGNKENLKKIEPKIENENLSESRNFIENIKIPFRLWTFLLSGAAIIIILILSL